MSSNVASNTSQENFEIKNLFGGACKIEIPKRFVDISDFRQIPDHQEVFGDGYTDQSFIIEILSREDEVSDAQAMQHFFNDLAEANEASQDARIISIQQLSDEQVPNFKNAYKAMLIGQQRVSKHKEQAKNTVNMYLFLVRLKQVDTDLLITLNDPVVIDPASSSATAATSSATAAASSSTTPGVNPHSSALFERAIKSFDIVDYGLFG